MAGNKRSQNATNAPYSSELSFLSKYPGAGLLVDANLKPLVFNSSGALLAKILEQNGSKKLSEQIKKASRVNAVIFGCYVISEGKNNIKMEVTALPQELGTGRVIVLGRDISLFKNSTISNDPDLQRYKELVELSSEFMWEVDEKGRFTFVSSTEALGYKPSELIGRFAKDLIVDPEAYEKLPFLFDRPLRNIEILFQNKDKTVSCMIVSSSPLITKNGEIKTWTGCRGTCQNITKIKDNEATLIKVKHREKLLNVIVTQIRNEVNPFDMLQRAAAVTAVTLGAIASKIYRLKKLGKYSVVAEYGDAKDDDVIMSWLRKLKLNDRILSFPTKSSYVIIAPTHYRNKINGALVIWISINLSQSYDDQKILICDVSHQLGLANEQVLNHEKMTELSRTDSMTGLLNRRAFYEEDMPRRLDRIARNEKTAAMFFVDMDNLKKINDTCGHHVGDEAILLVRDLLLDYSRPGDLTARLGGDEFVMWLDGIDLKTSELRAKRLIQASRVLAGLCNGKDISLSISIGVAFFEPSTGETLDSLISRADAAMYIAKKRGKGSYYISKK